MLERLKTRRQFLRVAATSRKCAMPGVVLQVAPQSSADHSRNGLPRYGLTVSRRVGNAVKRNRVRRRLRAAAEQILPGVAIEQHDYVLIGRKASIDRTFDGLMQDLEHGLRRLGATRQGLGEQDSKQ